MLLVLAVGLAFSLLGSLEVLAGATSMLLLLTFCLVHVALLRSPKRDKGFRVPRLLPLLGTVMTLGLVLMLPWETSVTRRWYCWTWFNSYKILFKHVCRQKRNTVEKFGLLPRTLQLTARTFLWLRALPNRIVDKEAPKRSTRRKK